MANVLCTFPFWTWNWYCMLIVLVFGSCIFRINILVLYICRFIWRLFDTRLLVNRWQFWLKINLCQSLLSVWHCIAVRDPGGKREQLCFRVRFCILLRYLRMNETNWYRNKWFGHSFHLLFLFGFCSFLIIWEFKIDDMALQIMTD